MAENKACPIFDAIHSYCLEQMDNDSNQVWGCQNKKCPFWPFRLGGDIFMNPYTRCPKIRVAKNEA